MYADKEVSHILLTHLDNRAYVKVKTRCENTILFSTIVDPIYTVSEIAGTNNQLRPSIQQRTPSQIRYLINNSD